MASVIVHDGSLTNQLTKNLVSFQIVEVVGLINHLSADNHQFLHCTIIIIIIFSKPAS